MASDEAMVASTISSGATLVGSKRKRNNRRKILIERIEDDNARQACFSRRLKSLFKKASELSILCGAQIAVIVFSEAGRRYCSIYQPSNTPSVLDQCISSPPVSGHTSQPDSLPDVTMQLSKPDAVLAAEKVKEKSLKEKIDGLRGSTWRSDVENLSLEELKVVKTRLFMARMAGRGDRPMVSLNDGEEMGALDAPGISVPNMVTSTKEGHVSVIKERNYFAESVQRQELGAAVSQSEMMNREVQEDNNVSDEIDLELKL